MSMITGLSSYTSSVSYSTASAVTSTTATEDEDTTTSTCTTSTSSNCDTVSFSEEALAYLSETSEELTEDTLTDDVAKQGPPQGGGKPQGAGGPPPGGKPQGGAGKQGPPPDKAV